MQNLPFTIFFAQYNNDIPALMAFKTTTSKYKIAYQNLKGKQINC